MIRETQIEKEAGPLLTINKSYILFFLPNFNAYFPENQPFQQKGSEDAHNESVSHQGTQGGREALNHPGG
jgi:hypothetical protein